MERISRTDLQNLRKNERNLHIVEVLSEDQYQKAHLPDAVNIPLGPNFEEQAKAEIPDNSEPVVVYCADLDCNASEKAAERLEAIGYTNVKDYAEGKRDWSESDEEMVRPSQAV